MLSAFLDNPIVTILICIASFSLIMKLAKVILKITVAGVIVFISFLGLRFLTVEEITPTDSFPSSYEIDKESIDKVDDSIYVSYNSETKINQRPGASEYQQLLNREADIVVRHNHFHYLSDGAGRDFRYLDEIYPETPNSLEIDEGEGLDLEDTILVKDISCDKIVSDNRYVIAVSFNAVESYAAAYVEELKKAGFHSARYIWLPCYHTNRTEEMYVVLIDRACRSIDSIKRKLKQNIHKAQSMDVEFPSKAIIHIIKGNPSPIQSHDWVKRLDNERSTFNIWA